MPFCTQKSPWICSKNRYLGAKSCVQNFKLGPARPYSYNTQLKHGAYVHLQDLAKNGSRIVKIVHSVCGYHVHKIKAFINPIIYDPARNCKFYVFSILLSISWWLFCHFFCWKNQRKTQLWFALSFISLTFWLEREYFMFQINYICTNLGTYTYIKGEFLLLLVSYMLHPGPKTDKKFSFFKIPRESTLLWKWEPQFIWIDKVSDTYFSVAVLT